jgi:hypothetical protein
VPLLINRPVFLNIAPNMAHGIVYVDDQWIFANPVLGSLVFFGYIRRNNGQEKVLIEFPFAEKDIKDQEFLSGENIVPELVL